LILEEIFIFFAVEFISKGQLITCPTAVICTLSGNVNIITAIILLQVGSVTLDLECGNYIRRIRTLPFFLLVSSLPQSVREGILFAVLMHVSQQQNPTEHLSSTELKLWENEHGGT
jgi:hypothetical protein